MFDDDWLEPLDRRIEEVRRETEAIRKANAALKRLYANNDEGMKRLADSQKSLTLLTFATTLSPCLPQHP
jgi:hypothetical protein